MFHFASALAPITGSLAFNPLFSLPYLQRRATARTSNGFIFGHIPNISNAFCKTLLRFGFGLLSFSFDVR